MHKLYNFIIATIIIIILIYMYIKFSIQKLCSRVTQFLEENILLHTFYACLQLLCVITFAKN